MNDQKILLLTNPFKTVITGICSHKDKLGFEQETDHGFKLTVVPHNADFPKLIGKGGRQSKAFEYLFQRAGLNLGFHAEIKFIESFVGEREEPKVQDGRNFDLAALESAVKEIAEVTMGCPVSIGMRQDGEKLIVKLNPLDATQKDAKAISIAINNVFFPYGKAKGRTVEVVLEKGA